MNKKVNKKTEKVLGKTFMSSKVTRLREVMERERKQAHLKVMEEYADQMV